MDQTSRLSFLCDERVQRLSAQAESFLNRVAEVFLRYPMTLDEHGRAPADPAQLRNLTYPHRPDIRHTYVERWFVELEAASLVTVRETEHGRWFELVHDPGRISSEDHPKRDASPKVIHIRGPDPPKRENEIIAVAAAATDSLDLIARLKAFFPRHDVAASFKRFVTHREKRSLALTYEAFARWMLKEEVPIVRKPKAPVAITPIEPIEPIERDEPDLFDQAEHRLFMKRYETHLRCGMKGR